VLPQVLRPCRMTLGTLVHFRHSRQTERDPAMDHPFFTSLHPQPECMEPWSTGTLRFACHPGISCFTNCCADLHLTLTPYDVLRLKSALSLPSGDFLERYTTDDVRHNSGLPVVVLKMGDDPKRRCPLLSPQGCLVYADRPGACRLYPVGRAARFVGRTLQEKFFLVREAHCLGFGEAREWTVEQWLADQGLKVYDEMNGLWMRLNRDAGSGQQLPPVTGDKLRMYFMACYNLDQFQRFVFESRFLRMFRVDEERKARIRTDQTELLKLAFAWLEFSLFGKKTMHIEPSMLKAKKRALARR
jgi:Fe-S-cluster containining protein